MFVSSRSFNIVDRVFVDPLLLRVHAGFGHDRYNSGPSAPGVSGPQTDCWMFRSRCGLQSDSMRVSALRSSCAGAVKQKVDGSCPLQEKLCAPGAGRSALELMRPLDIPPPRGEISTSRPPNDVPASRTRWEGERLQFGRRGPPDMPKPVCLSRPPPYFDPPFLHQPLQKDPGGLQPIARLR